MMIVPTPMILLKRKEFLRGAIESCTRNQITVKVRLYNNIMEGKSLFSQIIDQFMHALKFKYALLIKRLGKNLRRNY